MATLDLLRAALIELDEERTLALTRGLLEQGEVTSTSILHTCQQALNVVGERYERQEYYISGLIMAGEIFKEVLDLVQPSHEHELGEELAGTRLGDCSHRHPRHRQEPLRYRLKGTVSRSSTSGSTAAEDLAGVSGPD